MIWQLSILLAFAPLALSCTGAGTIVLDSSMTQFTLQSDNHPDPYPDSNDCEWIFTSPADTLVTLSCPNVNINGKCQENRFTYDIQGVVQPFCRGSLDATSSNNEMTVTFKTTKNQRRSTGFSCVVSFTTPQPPDNVTCSCGKRNSETSRVVGGEETSPHEYPWQALLLKDGYFICGGSLISNEWVVSAAHCLDGRAVAADYSVELGNHDRSTDDGEVTFSVSQIIIHNNYNRRRLINDIGLLRLASPAVYSSTISPVCLPFRYESDPTAFDEETTVLTGWGQLGTEDPSSDVLMEVDLIVLSYQECYSRHISQKIKVTNDMICAVDEGKGGCYGDSGGPLVYQNNGIDFLTGVVSWGYGGCANSDYATVFTRVTNYLAWLEINTGENFEVC